jgi:hypothetical protein
MPVQGKGGGGTPGAAGPALSTAAFMRPSTGGECVYCCCQHDVDVYVVAFMQSPALNEDSCSVCA